MTAPTSATRNCWWITPAVMLVGGVAVTAAATAGRGEHALSVFMSGLLVTLVAIGGFSAIGRRGDIRALFASASDERQRGIELRPSSAAGLTKAAILIVGSIVTLAQGHDAQLWVNLAAAFGVVYLICLLIFRRS